MLFGAESKDRTLLPRLQIWCFTNKAYSANSVHQLFLRGTDESEPPPHGCTTGLAIGRAGPSLKDVAKELNLTARNRPPCATSNSVLVDLQGYDPCRQFPCKGNPLNPRARPSFGWQSRYRAELSLLVRESCVPCAPPFLKL